MSWSLLKPDEADWLRVKTPSTALRGQTFPIEVKLLKGETGRYLSADLHWMNGDRESRGYLAGSKAQEIVEDKSVYNFEVTVPDQKEAAYVFAVIYISAQGSWGTQVNTASLKPTPVVKEVGEKGGRVIKTQGANRFKRNRGIMPIETGALHYMTVAVWFAVSLLALTIRKSRHSRWIAIAGFVSGIWELSNVSIILGNFLRKLTSYAGIYTDRRGPQVFMTLLLMILLAMLAFYLISKVNHTGKTVAWIAMVIFWGISFLRLFSLHEVDSLLTKSFAGADLWQLIELSSALVCLFSVIISHKSAWQYFKLKRNPR